MTYQERRGAVTRRGGPTNGTAPHSITDANQDQSQGIPAGNGRAKMRAYTTAEQREVRVTFQRTNWSRSQSRIFASPTNADRYVERLLSHDRPDLAPVAFVRLDTRSVGPWAPVTDRGNGRR